MKKVGTHIHNIPDDIAAQLRDIGKIFNEDVALNTREIYMPLLEGIDRSGISVTEDIAYGSHERNRLDVHVPDDLSGAPSVIFFHGGGFIRGDKQIAGQVLHGNVANFFVRNGMIGLNATYRLAPEAAWPDGAEDVGAALAWARENIADYGGDPDKIFLLGQSAGASHVATYVLRKRMHPNDQGPGCAGAICMSGVYGISAENAAPNQIAYYGEPSDQYAEMKVLGNVDHGDTPFMLSTAEFDMFGFEHGAVQLVAEIAEKFGWLARYKQMRGHNHVSQVYSIGTGDNGIGPDIVDFINQTLSG